MKSVSLYLLLLLLSFGFISFGQNIDIQSEVYSLSQTHESNKKYGAAIQIIEKVYESKKYEHNLRWGWLYFLDGDYDKSIKFYSKAISIEKKSIEARLGLAQPLEAMEEWRDLIHLYEEILHIDESNAVALGKLALIFYNENEYKKAYFFLKRKAEIYPGDFDNNLLLGRVLIKVKKKNEAGYYLERALLHSPDDPIVIGLLKSL